MRPLADRFWEKVKKTEGCWEWIAGVDKDGYGQIWVNGQMRRARAPRVAWFLETGKWPTLCVCHKCDNPKCVRFSHFFAGTFVENTWDRARKGRSARNINPCPGEKNGNARLTEEQVLSIRREYVRGHTRQVDFAEQFGVSQVLISLILRGIAWKYLDEHAGKE